MTRRLFKLPTVGGLAAGQTAVIECPLGRTYERFLITMNTGAVPADVLEANWGANITEIRVKVDGETKIQAKADHLVVINKFKGHSHDAGVLPVFLSQPWMRTINGEDAFAYGTAQGMDNMTIEVDIPTGVVINSFEVYAIQSDPMPFQSHYRLVQMTKTVSATGEIEISSIPRGPFVTTGIHLNSADIEQARVFRNDDRFYDTSKIARNQNLRISKKVPQAGFTHLDFVADNRLLEAVEMDAADFRLKLNFTVAPGSMPIYVESLQSPYALSY